MTLTHLLALLLSIFTAHAAPSHIISLHNDAALQESSVVSNWTLLCKHLCSLNLSGPACGLVDCNPTSYPVGDDGDSFTLSEHRELCETLCENGLGAAKCDCKVKIVPASSPKLLKPDKPKICYDFCRFRRVTLKGCAQCSSYSVLEYERHSKSRNSEEDDYFAIPHQVPPPPPPPLRAPLYYPTVTKTTNMVPIFPVAQRAERTFQKTTDATTPDWIKVCAQLCKGGSGGLLCNCDLPPL